MKKIAKTIVTATFVSILFIAGQSEAGTRVYVKIGPPRVRTVRVVKPAKPHRRIVWVSGHYLHKHGRYVWANGYWLKAKPGHVYVQAHWKKTPYGYRYVKGHWVRK